MQNLDRQKIIVALLLLWLALTGGYAGWGHPITLFINFLLWLALMVWLCVRMPRVDTLGWAIIGLMAATLVSAALTGHWYAGLTQAAILSGYLAFYYLARHWPDETIHHGAFCCLVVYSILCCIPWEHSNVLAFSFVGLAWLAWPMGGWGMLTFIAIFNLAYLGTRIPGLYGMGCYLALLAGATVIVWRRFKSVTRWAIVASMAVPLLLLDWIVGSGTYVVRLIFWLDALIMFLASPLWGGGPGSYESVTYWHAHNLPLTTAAELGLFGLMAVGGIIWSIWKNRTALPAWAAALTVAFAIWSLVDEPTRFWGPGAMLMIAWSRTR